MWAVVIVGNGLWGVVIVGFRVWGCCDGWICGLGCCDCCIYGVGCCDGRPSVVLAEIRKEKLLEAVRQLLPLFLLEDNETFSFAHTSTEPDPKPVYK